MHSDADLESNSGPPTELDNVDTRSFTEKVRGIYKGLLTNMVTHMISQAVYFASYGIISEQVKEMRS